MITVFAENKKDRSIRAIIDIPASDGKIKDFRKELGVSSDGEINIRYAGTEYEFTGMDAVFSSEISCKNFATIDELNLLSYLLERMDGQQIEEFDDIMREHGVEPFISGISTVFEKAYGILEDDHYSRENYECRKISEFELITAERNMLKPYLDMNKDVFWQMIGDAREKCGGDYDMIQMELTEQLSLMSPQDIRLYKDINDEYVRLADREGVYEAGSGLQFPGERSGLSDDGFLDFRCWLIGQGKEIYMNTMKNPDSLLSAGLSPRGDYYEWECFNYIAYDAYDKNTGSDLYDQPHEITQEQKDEIASEIEYGEANKNTQESELAEVMREQGMGM